MTSLLTIRDGIRDFFRAHDVIVTPVLRFFYALVLFFGLNLLYGYSDITGSFMVILAMSLLCAFVSEGFMLLLVGFVSALNCLSVSLESAAVYVVLFIVMYYMYIRFCPKTAYIIMFAPLLYLLNLHYLLPILVGILVGPVGIIPAAFGVIIYYFSQYLEELDGLIMTATEDEAVNGIMYLLTGLAEDRRMYLTIIVFAVVIMVTYIVYRLSIKNGWYIAIIASGLVEILMFLMGSYAMEAEINIGTILIGTIIGMALALVVQFFKGTVDYSRTEVVQFEDDEYYYYVKAVPKLTVSAKNVSVQKINERVDNEQQ